MKKQSSDSDTRKRGTRSGKTSNEATEALDRSLKLKTDTMAAAPLDGKVSIEEFRDKKYIVERMSLSKLEQAKKESRAKGVKQTLELLANIHAVRQAYSKLKSSDQELLHQAVHSEGFATLHPKAVVQTLVYAQKTRLVRVLAGDEINNALAQVCGRLKELSDGEVAALCLLLTKAKKFEEK